MWVGDKFDNSWGGEFHWVDNDIVEVQGEAWVEGEGDGAVGEFISWEEDDSQF
jgi:hypothetical protein